jgi:hypothetical protein
MDVQLRMFQFADFDSTGTIEAEEFEVAWKYLKEHVTESLVAKLGLDDGSIFKNALVVLTFFALCMVLVFRDGRCVWKGWVDSDCVPAWL